MDFKEVINNRRAVNFFDPQKPVPDKILKEIIETAAQAPSSFNLQPWNLIVLKEPQEKMRLQKLAWDQPKVSQAPVVLIVLADRNAWQPGHSILEKNFTEMVTSGTMTTEQHQWFLDACRNLYGTDEEKQQAFANKNSGFFAMALMLAAKNLGLDSHPMDGFDHDDVRREFNIPDHYWIPLLLAVGYFSQDKTLLPAKWRKAYDEIVVNFN
jgi:nitroreductase